MIVLVEEIVDEQILLLLFLLLGFLISLAGRIQVTFLDISFIPIGAGRGRLVFWA